MRRGTIIVTPNEPVGAICKIGPGVKIFGAITLGNNIRIGANAVVNKTFSDDNILLVGIPAKAVPLNILEG
jgi:serine O-acetyltransferase